MRSARAAIVDGMAAGAAGTTALNAVTYLDMAIRGRPSSNTPQTTVEKVADATRVKIPGPDEQRRNRLSGLGPLTGIVTGIGCGAVVGVAHARGWPRGSTGMALIASAFAMASANAPMTAFGVTDPRSWTAKEWVSDAIPHLAYGAVTAFVLRALTRDPRPV